MTIDLLKEEIVEQIQHCPQSQVRYVWKVLYEDWEDFPDNRQETIELIEEEMSCVDEIIKIKRIHKKLFGNDDTGDE
jgi:hypothetical protein